MSAGNRTVNTEPLSGSLDTVTPPPIMRASFRRKPKPGAAEMVVAALNTAQNGS